MSLATRSAQPKCAGQDAAFPVLCDLVRLLARHAATEWINDERVQVTHDGPIAMSRREAANDRNVAEMHRSIHADRADEETNP